MTWHNVGLQIAWCAVSDVTGQYAHYPETLLHAAGPDFA